MSSIIIPPTGPLVDSFGQPIMRAFETVGLNVFEQTGGKDSLAAIAEVAELRRRRERVGTITVAPGQVTRALLEEVAIFNAEAYRGDELPAAERDRIIAAVRKRWRKRTKGIE